MNFTLDEIRKDYTFDASCAGSVPQAIRTFPEEDSFAEVLSAAIPIGGDSDTIAAITETLAEVIYPISQTPLSKAIDRMDSHLLSIIEEAVDFAWHRQSYTADKEDITV